MDISLPALRNPTDVLAVVPYLLGFAPEDSLVVLGLRGRRLVFQARSDLVPADSIDESARHLAGVFARQRVDAALMVGYGPEAIVTPQTLALRTAMVDKGIQVLEAMRAEDGRYWSYVCERPDCCSPEGTPYDVSTSAVAATATYAGLNPAPSRDVLVARLAPPDGLARLAAREAAERADARLRALLAIGGDGEDLALIGTTAVERLAIRHRFGTPLDNDEIAWVGTLLAHAATRDRALELAGADPVLHVELWTEVLHRVDARLAAAPATLLAFAAWQCGDGAVAAIALERALTTDPAYMLAQMLTDAIDNGIPPARWHELGDPWGEGGRRRGRRGSGRGRERRRSRT